MGVNIYAYRILNDHFQDLEGWESARHSGDGELYDSGSFNWKYYDATDYESRCRPVDLDLAIDWVKSNIEECNQSRLIDLFELMKSDENVWIHFSF